MSGSFNQTWIEGLNELSAKIARRYRQNAEQEIQSLQFKSVTDPLLETYNYPVRENQIPRMEDLADDHKRVLWEKSKEVSNEQYKRILVCKCIYLLDVLIEKY